MDELIKALRNNADHYGFVGENGLVHLLTNAADAIEQLNADLERSKEWEAFWEKEANEALKKFQTAVANKPRWIPVEERLPEEQINPNTQDFEYVLCVTIWDDVRPFKYGAQIGHREAHFWNGAGYVDAYVTHWMPLPEPPKEE